MVWFERSDKKLLRVALSAMGTNRGSFPTMTPKIWNHHIVWGRVFWLHLKKKMELLIQYVSYSLTNFQWLPSGNKVVKRTRRAFSQIALSYYYLLRRVIKTFFVCWFAFVLLCVYVCLFICLFVCLFWQWYRADLTLLCHMLIQELMSTLRRISTTSYG